MTNLFIQMFNQILNFTSDYGIAIILFTLLIKIALLPLTIKQKKSMKIQQELSRKMAELKNQYKDNQEMLNEEMLKLYKENPGSGFGFLTLFLQMPIFVAMYKTFAHNIVDSPTVILPWINNLSSPNPYFILPILYIITQLLPGFLSYVGIIKNSSIPKLTPMSIVPAVMISLLFLTKSPAALGLYFIVSNIFTNIEQLIPVSE